MLGRRAAAVESPSFHPWSVAAAGPLGEWWLQCPRSVGAVISGEGARHHYHGDPYHSRMVIKRTAAVPLSKPPLAIVSLREGHVEAHADDWPPRAAVRVNRPRACLASWRQRRSFFSQPGQHRRIETRHYMESSHAPRILISLSLPTVRTLGALRNKLQHLLWGLRAPCQCLLEQHCQLPT